MNCFRKSTFVTALLMFVWIADSYADRGQRRSRVRTQSSQRSGTSTSQDLSGSDISSQDSSGSKLECNSKKAETDPSIPFYLIRKLFADADAKPEVERGSDGHVKIKMPSMLNVCSDLYTIRPMRHYLDNGTKKYLSVKFALRSGKNLGEFVKCLSEVAVVGKTENNKRSVTRLITPNFTNYKDEHLRETSSREKEIIKAQSTTLTVGIDQTKKDAFGKAGDLHKWEFNYDVMNELSDNDFTSQHIKVPNRYNWIYDRDGNEIEYDGVLFASEGSAYKEAYSANGSQNGGKHMHHTSERDGFDCTFLEKWDDSSVTKVPTIAEQNVVSLQAELDNMGQNKEDCLTDIVATLRKLLDAGKAGVGSYAAVVDNFEKARDEIYKDEIKALGRKLFKESRAADEADEPENKFKKFGADEQELLGAYIDNVIQPTVDRLEKLANFYETLSSPKDKDIMDRVRQEMRELRKKLAEYTAPFTEEYDPTEYDMELDDEYNESNLLDNLRLAGKFGLAKKIADIMAMAMYTRVMDPDDEGDEGELHDFETVETKVASMIKNNDEENSDVRRNYYRAKQSKRYEDRIAKGKVQGVSRRLDYYAKISKDRAYQLSRRIISSAESKIKSSLEGVRSACQWQFTSSQRDKCNKAKRKHLSYQQYVTSKANLTSSKVYNYYNGRAEVYSGRARYVKGLELKGQRYLAEKRNKRKGRRRSGFDNYFYGFDGDASLTSLTLGDDYNLSSQLDLAGLNSYDSLQGYGDFDQFGSANASILGAGALGASFATQSSFLSPNQNFMGQQVQNGMLMNRMPATAGAAGLQNPALLQQQNMQQLQLLQQQQQQQQLQQMQQLQFQQSGQPSALNPAGFTILR